MSVQEFLKQFKIQLECPNPSHLETECSKKNPNNKLKIILLIS